MTGGIAAYKSAYLARLLIAAGADVQAAMTSAATRFLGPDTLAAITARPVYTDVFARPEEVLHVRLARDTDAVVVAPATANFLAKLALGLSDDLLSATLLESSAPMVLAPAMHSGMWRHPAIRRHVQTLLDRGARVVGPAEGPLAAGDEGPGRMSEPEEICKALAEMLAAAGRLAGLHLLVTAGPTHEPLDAVRFLGNRSSGKMGYSVAAEAARRGAIVTLISGPVNLPEPPGVEVVRVETSADMDEAVSGRYADVDAVVMAAAVSDFRPKAVLGGKHKKEAGVPRVELEPTADVLAKLGKLKERQVLVGFAAETHDPVEEGRRKLREKNLDLLVANRVGEPGTGFAADTNWAAILARSGDDTPLRRWTKRELAAALCDRLASLIPRAPG